MSKSFLTRIATASAAVSLLAFSTALPVKAAYDSENITLTGEIPATCALASGTTTGGIDNVSSNATSIDLDGNAKVVVTVSVADIFVLDGSVTSLTVGGIDRKATADFSTMTYKIGDGTATAINPDGSVTTAPVTPTTATDVVLNGTIGGTLVDGSTEVTDTGIAVNMVYTFTCAPRNQ